MLLFISRIFCKFPLSWAMAAGKGLGLIWYYILPIRRKVARENIKLALGNELNKKEQKKVARDTFISLARVIMEEIRLPIWSGELSKNLVRRENFENMEAALAKGKGIILVGIHIGSFDLLGASIGATGLPIAGIFKDIKSGPTQSFVSEARKHAGIEIIPPRKSKDQIIEYLSKGYIIGFAIDQHMHNYRGVVCEFFGYPASTMHAPARFALQTGAPIIPTLFIRDKKPGYHIIRFEPEFMIETPSEDINENIRHNTERLNRVVEGWIRQYPGQYLWLHKRWKAMQHPDDFDIPEHLKKKIVSLY